MKMIDLIVQKIATRKLSEVFEYKATFQKHTKPTQKYVSPSRYTLYQKGTRNSRAASFQSRKLPRQKPKPEFRFRKSERTVPKSSNLALTSDNWIERQKWFIYFFSLVSCFWFNHGIFLSKNRQQKS